MSNETAKRAKGSSIALVHSLAESYNIRRVTRQAPKKVVGRVATVKGFMVQVVREKRNRPSQPLAGGTSYLIAAAEKQFRTTDAAPQTMPDGTESL